MSEKDSPTTADVQLAEWFEMGACLLKVGKKILCCPPADRRALMRDTVRFARGWEPGED